MILSFSYNQKQVLSGLKLLACEKHSVPIGLWFRFPFPENVKDSDFIKKIQEDELLYNPANVLRGIIFFWNSIENKVILSLESYAQENNIKLLESYYSYITFYGPHGFFVFPNNAYINISSQKSVEFYCETVLHELLHIILKDKIELLSYKETEQYIDDIFIQLWGDIFPHYQKQKFFDF